MNKSWIDLNDESSNQNKYGLESFLKFVLDNKKDQQGFIVHTRNVSTGTLLQGK